MPGVRPNLEMAELILRRRLALSPITRSANTSGCSSEIGVVHSISSFDPSFLSVSFLQITEQGGLAVPTGAVDDHILAGRYPLF